jgi:ATP-dependent exoDNAse (exonuclease V) beta subunit
MEHDRPKNIDAVHVMTVHKAKGLGFPVVLVVLYEERSKGFDYIVAEDEEGLPAEDNKGYTEKRS